MLAVSRISSLSGMSAAVAAPVAAIVLEEWMYVPALVVIAAIVLVLHRENIARLRAGTEPRIGRK
jgi:glycerol-3-phosphate acyltransferase PlsY